MYVAWKEATLKTDTWTYDVHRTCAHTTAVLRGIRHVTTKQRCKYTTSLLMMMQSLMSSDVVLTY